jgi:hypothetical protein
MTPRQRVLSVLSGNSPDAIPLTVAEELLPRGWAERELRNAGLCVVVTSQSPYRVLTPKVTRRQITFDEHGSTYTRTELQTPDGDLTETVCADPDGGTSWMVDRPFKSPSDYAALRFLVNDMQVVPVYERVARARARWGEDGVLIGRIDYSPLMEVIYAMMGLEAFSLEWHERRDEVLGLYEAVRERHREIYRVLAGAPVDAVSYDANVSAEVVGVDRFTRYCVPCYNELADALGDSGIPFGLRLDANATDLAEAAAAVRADFIDGFTPAPDTDMTVAEAMTWWPDTALWVNIPPTLFGQPEDSLETALRQMLFEAAPGERLLMGATDGVASDRVPGALSVAIRLIEREAALPIRWSSRRRNGQVERA